MKTNTNVAPTDIPAAGAKALSDYIKDCDAHAIQPDVGGAFAYAFRAGAALTTAAAVPHGFRVTEEMHVAACKVLTRAHGLDGLPQRMLDAMFAAAPKAAPVPAGEYPALPEPCHRGPAGTGSYFDAFTSDQMRAYVDADRAMRAQAEPATVATKAGDLLGVVRTAQAQAHRLIHGEDVGSDLDQTKRDLPETLRVIEHAISAPAAAAGPSDGPAGSGGWQSHAEAMERERDYYRQRSKTMAEHQSGEAWYWQGDGNDHPESMANSLPVVIRADVLRALIAAAPTTQAAPQPAVQQGDCPTMDDAIAAGDGTLHGAIDHWQRRALDAERVLLSRGLVLEEAAKACEERERRANREDVRATCRLCAKDIRSLAVVNQSLTTGPTANPEAPAAQGDAEDAARYRWLRERMLGIDFDWNESGITALSFEMPDGCAYGGCCNQNIDAARSQAKEGGA